MPGSTIPPKIRRGKPNRSSIGKAQSPACGSKHCEVVALVRSLEGMPERSQWKRSGIISIRSAAASTDDSASAMARSWKSELISMNCSPVAANMSSRLTVFSARASIPRVRASR